MTEGKTITIPTANGTTMTVHVHDGNTTDEDAYCERMSAYTN